MSKPRVQNDKETALLDDHYKLTLSHLKPYILQLKNKQKEQLYREWIERLNHATNEKTLRNQYIEALYEELKSGGNGEIFRNPPPKGPLVPLSEQSITEFDLYSETSENTERYYPSHNSWMRCRQLSLEKNSSSVHETDSATSHGEVLPPKVRFATDNKTLCVRFNMSKERLEELSTEMKRLRMENDHSSRELCRRQGCGDVNELHHLHEIIERQDVEINQWKSKLMEVQQMKRDLEESHNEIIEHCKDAMNEQFQKFKARLLEEARKNHQLKENVNALRQKVETLAREKADELAEKQKEYEMLVENIQKQFREDSKKLEIINQELLDKSSANVGNILQLTNKIQELENKLQTKTEEETKLRSLLNDQYSTMTDELIKIRNEMEMANQSKSQELTDKISYLKKSLLKLEKSKQKMILEYKEKLLRLEKDKEMEMKTLELQLQGQRNELSTSLSTEKQCELDSLLNMLEERYKGLLVSTEAVADNQRQKYLQKLTDLEDQLSYLKNSLIADGTYV